MKIEKALNQKKFESSIQKAVINLIYTYNWVINNQEDSFKPFEITSQQYNVLRILRDSFPNAISAGKIKELMLDKNPDLTRLCDRLNKKKFIEREINQLNKRQVIIKITKIGLDLLKEIEPKIKKQSKKYNLSDKEAEKLSKLLDKMRG